MQVLLYHIFLGLFRLAIRIASPFNKKAQQWREGRKGVMEYLEQRIQPADRVLWMHCASLGEFEQGRPLLEALRLAYPGHKLLLTFFSPSGYEVQKKYQGADYICYLPLDGPRTAKRFISLTHPELVIFVKYEFWFFYLKKIFYQQIPLLLVSALFRKEMNFFKWYGALSRKMLARFQHVFVQNEASLQLVKHLGLGAISSVAGDTRFDRVLAIASKAHPLEDIEAFSAQQPLLVAGSTWPEDEIAIQKALQDPQLDSLKLIVAPHEISAGHLAALQDLFKDSIRYSEWKKDRPATRVLIIDNYGMLSRLYRYATIAYVGGGLHKAGLHNTLEAAVYSIPVLVGPVHTKHAEALALLEQQAAFSFGSQAHPATLQEILIDLHNHPERCRTAGQKAGAYVRQQAGATKRILSYIQENRLLTN
ncbi:MAG: 3-deoxy-D-manno-octulosonic acid transferase [Sphingomonadales bacterium]